MHKNSNNSQHIFFRFISEEDVIVVKTNEPTPEAVLNNNELYIKFFLKENDLIGQCSVFNEEKLLNDNSGENSDDCIVSSYSELNIQQKIERAENEAEIKSDDIKSFKDQGDNESSGNARNLPQPIQEIIDAVHQKPLLEETEENVLDETLKGTRKSPKKRAPRSQTLNDKMGNYKCLNKYMLSSTPRQRQYFLQLPRGVGIKKPGDECKLMGIE